ncbi:GntR family transcriptional regulator [Lacibacterium aquatile]|uniref:GntR family transcriptional regulator n=1 Tax=Lacibacterium aquatile TaxID=1168082 RepID=A0ABW5DRF3_9PROT
MADVTVLKRSTITDEVRERLADEILLGTFAPGVRLDEHGLAERYGVSRTPIREALKQLAVMGLTEAKPHRGVFVSQVSPERLASMFEAVADLEAACARHAALRMTLDQRERLAALHENSIAMVKSGDFDGYDRLNRQLHALIHEGARNEFLVDAVARLRGQTTPYRRAQFRHKSRIEQSFAEHQTLVAAILKGDGEGAWRAMQGHLAKAGGASAEFFAKSATPVALPSETEPAE